MDFAFWQTLIDDEARKEVLKKNKIKYTLYQIARILSYPLWKIGVDIWGPLTGGVMLLFLAIFFLPVGLGLESSDMHILEPILPWFLGILGYLLYVVVGTGLMVWSDNVAQQLFIEMRNVQANILNAKSGDQNQQLRKEQDAIRRIRRHIRR